MKRLFDILASLFGLILLSPVIAVVAWQISRKLGSPVLFRQVRPGKDGKPYTRKPIYRDFRAGDVRHSQADISKASSKLGYAPEYRIMDGIAKAMPWYIENV